jgi:hypothetical protein
MKQYEEKLILHLAGLKPQTSGMGAHQLHHHHCHAQTPDNADALLADIKTHNFLC